MLQHLWAIHNCRIYRGEKLIPCALGCAYVDTDPESMETHYENVHGLTVPSAFIDQVVYGDDDISFPDKNSSLFHELFTEMHLVHDGHQIFPCTMCSTAYLSHQEVADHYRKIHRFNISALHLRTMKVQKSTHGYYLDETRNLLHRVPRHLFISRFAEYLKENPNFIKPWMADKLRKEWSMQGRNVPPEYYLTMASSLTLHLYANEIKAQWDTGSIQYASLGERHRAGLAFVKDNTYIRTTKKGWDIILKITQEIITDAQESGR